MTFAKELSGNCFSEYQERLGGQKDECQLDVSEQSMQALSRMQDMLYMTLESLLRLRAFFETPGKGPSTQRTVNEKPHDLTRSTHGERIKPVYATPG